MQKNIQIIKNLYLGDKKTALDVEIKSNEIINLQICYGYRKNRGLEVTKMHHDDWRMLEHSLFDGI